MVQRLVWNFECAIDKPFPVTAFKKNEQDEIKWEARFFWPQNEIISLCATDESMLSLTHYKTKQREDEYYLLPDANYNIKRRRNELLYKPIRKESSFATAFGPKLNLEESIDPDLKKILIQLKDKGTVVHVTKEAFIYKFKTTPVIKLELSKLKVFNAIYFSVCIEGRSAYLVEQISKHLLGEQLSCDYVTFLKHNLKS